MEYQYSYKDKTYTVTIQKKADNAFVAEIGSSKVDFEFTILSENCVSILSHGKSHTVYLGEMEEKTEVFMAGQHLEIVEALAKSRSSQAVLEHRSRTAEYVVTAPMPGRILKIMVSEKQVVKLNVPLFIIESMKMENEVLSPRDGKVQKINYKVNDLVSVGDPIVEFENKEKK